LNRGSDFFFGTSSFSNSTNSLFFFCGAYQVVACSQVVVDVFSSPDIVCHIFLILSTKLFSLVLFLNLIPLSIAACFKAFCNSGNQSNLSLIHSIHFNLFHTTVDKLSVISSHKYGSF